MALPGLLHEIIDCSVAARRAGAGIEMNSSDVTKKTITNRRCVAIDFHDTSRPQLGIQYAFNDTWISLKRKHARIVGVLLCVIR